jgi:hypothetical protein
MAKRTKVTPKWISIVRKIYTYIGSTSLFGALGGIYDLNEHQILFMVTMYLIGLNAVQTICDMSYQKEDSDVYKL